MNQPLNNGGAISPNHSVRRFNTLLKHRQMARYLEIGVFTGDTFRQIQAQHKIAVDPNFLFDPKTEEDQDSQYFEVTSDQYFQDHAPNEPFDLAFIDGLHTFEQCLRDLMNVLSVTHNESIIVIDDTVPSDIFSTLPSMEAAHRFRQQHGQSERPKAWHGDVFKVVFFIHQFLPWLSYVTTEENGNGQTFVWRNQKQRDVTWGEPLETLSKLDWFALQSHLDVLNLQPEQTALDLVLSDIQHNQ